VVATGASNRYLTDMAGNDLIVYTPSRLARLERLSPLRFWRRVQRAIGGIAYLEEIVAGFYCALDRATPVGPKAALLGALVLLVLPSRRVPALVRGFGYSGDLASLLAALQALRGHISDEHRARARHLVARLRATS
jgi:uncharacterized membrane protein YkvA (DUF1232 family)